MVRFGVVPLLATGVLLCVSACTSSQPAAVAPGATSAPSSPTRPHLPTATPTAAAAATFATAVSAPSPPEPAAQPPVSVSATVHPTPTNGRVVVTDQDGFGASAELIDVPVGTLVEFDLQAWSPAPTLIDPAMTMQPSVLSPVSSSSAPARTSSVVFRTARPGLAYVFASEVGDCGKGACAKQGVTFYIQVT